LAVPRHIGLPPSNLGKRKKKTPARKTPARKTPARKLPARKPVKKKTPRTRKSGAKHVNHVVLLLDETSSMLAVKTTTISGVNEFTDSLKKDAGDKLLFTFVTFNTTRFHVVNDATPARDIKKINEDTYIPTAMTPLHDSIGRVIGLAEKTRADSVLVAIYTDGEENSSKEFTLAKVRDLIEAKKKLGWQFSFMGVDIDAYRDASKYGIARGATVSTLPEYAHLHTHILGESVGRWRTASARGQSATMEYSDDEKLSVGDTNIPNSGAGGTSNNNA
jgi:hypothetical protein